MNAKNNRSRPNKTKPTKQKTPFTLWIRGQSGKPSISATFATVSFFTTTAVYIISIFEKIGPYAIRPFDSTACGIYLVPIMSLYFGRRWTDSKFGNTDSHNSENEYRDRQQGNRQEDEEHFKGVEEEGSDEDNSK